MNRSKYILRFFSCVLLALYSFTVVPVSSFHIDKPVCDGANPTLENDPCHLAIYHHNEHRDKQCHDKAHLNMPVKQCEWCKHLNYLPQHLDESKEVAGKTEYVSYLFTFYSFSFHTSLQALSNKGPPAFLA